MRKLLLIIACFVSLVCKGQANDSTQSDFFLPVEKGEKTALLMVHFGTTHDDTRALTIDALNKKVKKTFPQLDVYEAYTSRIIMKRLKERGIIKHTPVEMLLWLRSEGYTHIIVQGTNIISGIEHEMLLKEVESVRPFFKDIRVGNPLLYSVEDATNVIEILTKRHSINEKKGEHVVFVGHGTSTPATAIYSQFDYMLKANGCANYHVGTIEGYPTFETMSAQLKVDKAKSVVLVPFMFVAGDHAKNDISVDWKEDLEKVGYKVSLAIEGLGQIPEVQDIFIEHIRHSLK